MKRSILLLARTIAASACVALVAATEPTLGRIAPEADHTVWVTIESAPVGAEIYSRAAENEKPVRIGSTPCRVPVDLNWGRKWFVKRWELLTVESPAAIFRGEWRQDGAYDILLKARLSKPGYVEQELDVLAFTLPHPGKDWAGQVLWPREARVYVAMRPAPDVRSDSAQSPESPLRKVWVAESRAVEETGSVVVRANVESADVWVDGRRVAVAPVELILSDGAHELEVRKPGYRGARRRIMVEPDRRNDYEAILEREP